MWFLHSLPIILVSTSKRKLAIPIFSLITCTHWFPWTQQFQSGLLDQFQSVFSCIIAVVWPTLALAHEGLVKQLARCLRFSANDVSFLALIRFTIHFRFDPIIFSSICRFCCSSEFKHFWIPTKSFLHLCYYQLHRSRPSIKKKLHWSCNVSLQAMAFKLSTDSISRPVVKPML